MKRRRLPKLRAILVAWHRWFGLLAGLWLFLLAFTGSIVVFYEEIDRALNPELWKRPVVGEPLPTANLVAAAEKSREGSYASFVDLPDASSEPLVAYLAARPGSDVKIPRGLHVFVDPYSGEVLGDRVFGAFHADRKHFAQFVYQLHRDLKLGYWGSVILGLVALLWVFDHLAAAWLSFPNPRRWWRSFRVRRGARGAALAYGLHRASGLWLLPVTLVLAVSGVYFEWHGPFRAAVDALFPLTPSYARSVPKLEEPQFDPPIRIDRGLEAASLGAGGARVDSISISPHRGYYRARIFDPRDLASYGQRSVYIDMSTAEVLDDRHVRDGSAGDLILAWQYPLHSGRAFGWPGRIAILLAGVAVCALVITGFVIWAKKRRGRKALAARTLGT